MTMPKGTKMITHDDDDSGDKDVNVDNYNKGNVKD